MAKDIYETIAERIIKEQENIIGPLAVDQAKKVKGIKLDLSTHSVQIEGNKKETLEQLVIQYENLFGRTSVEVCKDAIRGLEVSKDQLPPILQV